jgi:hypothetical protein
VTRSASSHEDLLTETVAFVLDAEAELAGDLVATLGQLPLPSGHVVVWTQLPTGYGKDRVDLVLESQEARIWIEIKKDSKEGPKQLERYARALAASKPHRSSQRRVLVYLARSGEAREPVDSLLYRLSTSELGIDDVVPYDWQSLGNLSRARGTPLAKHLHQFLAQQGVWVNGLTNEHVTALEHFDSARESLWMLCRETADEIRRRGSVGGWKRHDLYPRTRGRWGSFPGFWDTYLPATAEDKDGEPDLILEWNFDVDTLDDGKAVFSVGLSLNGNRWPTWDGWDGVEAITDLGYQRLTYASWPRLFKPKGADELSPGIEHQVSELASWIESAFSELVERLPTPPPSSDDVRVVS